MEDIEEASAPDKNKVNGDMLKVSLGFCNT